MLYPSSVEVLPLPPLHELPRVLLLQLLLISCRLSLCALVVASVIAETARTTAVPLVLVSPRPRRFSPATVYCRSTCVCTSCLPRDAVCCLFSLFFLRVVVVVVAAVV